MDQPNVLFVMSDEQSWDTLGVNGNAASVTPNLDRLAGEGTNFDGCYTPFPLCCPSRTSLWTGRMPRHHGVLGNWRPIETSLQGAGFAQAFRHAGYHTYYNGKWHVPGTTPSAMGWERASAIPPVVDGQDRGRYIDEYRTWVEARGYTLDPDHIENLTADDIAAMRDRPYATSSVPLESFLESWQTDQFLADLLRRPRGAPWLAACSFNAPHFPLVVPAPFDALVDRAEVSAPASLATGHAAKPREVRESRYATDFEHLTDDDWREAIAHYLGLCALVDSKFGQIRAALEAEGEWDRTIVVFTSDHGDMMGAHGLMEKGHVLHYEEALRVPLIMKAPGRQPARTDELVSVCDVGPTLCELAGVPWGEDHDGRSVAALVGQHGLHRGRDYVIAETMLRDGHPGGSGESFRAADWQWPRDSINLSVRTRSHRYIFRSDDQDELYDLVADPHEQNNVVDDPRCAPVVERLRAVLVREVGDVLPHAAALVGGGG